MTQPTASQTPSDPTSGPKADAYEAEVRSHLDAIRAVCTRAGINWFAYFALDGDADAIRCSVTADNTCDDADETGGATVCRLHSALQPTGGRLVADLEDVAPGRVLN